MTASKRSSTSHTPFNKQIDFYGLEVIQNASQPNLVLYNGTIDAKDLTEIVSIDNPVSWDVNSQTWKAGGRNRTIEESHWQAIRDYLSNSSTSILPSPVIISVQASAFNFSPFPHMAKLVKGVNPGVISINAPFVRIPGQTNEIAVEEDKRVAWVVDGQHRIRAFRDLSKSMPLNVLIIKQWKGNTYDDVMRHQTYELNMGRPLTEDFRAAVREDYKSLVGGDAYKAQIAVSWIRKNLESRGGVFSTRIVGAPKLRVPYKVKMSLVESVLRLAYNQDPYLQTNYPLTSLTPAQVVMVGDHLFNFYEGVRQSLGEIAPQHQAAFSGATNYWDVATIRKNPQRLLHNVGLKAVTRALVYEVMRVPDPNSATLPQSPQDVADRLEKMKGIPWGDPGLLAAKDDWVKPFATALGNMYADPVGTLNGQTYMMTITKGAQTLVLTCQC